MRQKLLLIFILFFHLTTVLASQDSVSVIFKLLREDFENQNYEKSYELCLKIIETDELQQDNDKYKNTLYRLVYSAVYIGDKSRDRGDFYQADFFYKKALYHLNENNMLDAFSKAYLYDIIGFNYNNLGKFELSIKNIEKAISLYPDNRSKYKGSAYTNVATAYYRLGEVELSENNYKKGIKLLEQNSSKNQYEIANAYTRYGLMCLYENKSDKAEKLLWKAYDAYKIHFGTNDFSISNILNHLGHFYKSTGEYKKSIKFFHSTITGLIPDFKDTCVYNYPSSKQLVLDKKLLYALRYKAHAFYQYYKFKTNDIKDLKASFETFELTFALIEKSRKESFSEESRLYFTDSYKETLNNAMLTAYELYNITSDSLYLDKMFEYSEKGKSSLLHLSVVELQSKKAFGIPDTLLNLENRLKSDISRLKTETEEGKSENKKLIKAIKKHEYLTEALKKQYPEYYRLKNEVKELTLDEVQKSINKNEVVIEYALTDTLLFVFTIDNNASKVITKRIDSVFYDNIKLIRALISEQHTNPTLSQLKQFVAVSYYLYQYLIEPVALQIKDKKLVIIPDKELLNIPFEVLVTNNDSNPKSYKNLPYLLFDNSIRYVYSATLQVSKQRDKQNNKKLLTFSPDYSILKNRIDDGSDYLKFKNNLSVLSFAEKEAQFITDLFDGDFYNNSDATEINFKEQSSDYGIIHLSMHSMLDNEHPMFSKLFFTYNNDTTEDHCLNTYELYNLHLNADLVVLSGCNTGNGKLLGGEGLMSIARGFIYSGCNSLALTLWNVNDEASYNITTGFYKYLKSGKTKDEAMQFAKIDYLKNSNHLNTNPYFWSGYILVGDNLPLKNYFSNNFKWLYSALSLLFAVIVLFLFKKKIKKNLPPGDYFLHFLRSYL